MAIKISLPRPSDFAINTLAGMKSYLRQLELAVHHAQKSVEEMAKNDEINEDSFIIYRFPSIDLDSRDSDDKGFVKVHVDEETEEMQLIEIEIN